jgi:teichuronic acid exporter
LAPADFGLIGMASVAIAFLLVLTETGIAPAIIQRAEIDESTLNSAWVISVAAVAGGLN